MVDNVVQAAGTAAVLADVEIVVAADTAGAAEKEVIYSDQ